MSCSDLISVRCKLIRIHSKVNIHNFSTFEKPREHMGLTDFGLISIEFSHFVNPGFDRKKNEVKNTKYIVANEFKTSDLFAWLMKKKAYLLITF